ncbi:CRISPR-associated endonuclease Cas2 [Ileibacterium valens]|uniref:CRISPR-associated endonuclease Cas2 n=1 Tax=Ileibacterium valens TaxID=1862668 RepID=UPI002573D135|nr:CRISPR-associated endonuclease Cas2 [Ileibacterium valens]
MNVICTYDISSGTTSTKVKKVLRRYLFHIQNSVFHGEITPHQFKKLKDELGQLIANEEDQVIFFYTQENKQLKECTIGKDHECENII